MNLYYVEATSEPKKRQRKARVWRYYVMAEHADAAYDKVADERVFTYEHADRITVKRCEADPDGTFVVSIGAVTR